MDRFNIVKEMFNEKFLHCLGDFSETYKADVKYDFFDIFNRFGTKVGNAPGVEVTLNTNDAARISEISPLARFFNIDIEDKKENGITKSFRFIDKKQTKYYRVI